MKKRGPYASRCFLLPAHQPYAFCRPSSISHLGRNNQDPSERSKEEVLTNPCPLHSASGPACPWLHDDLFSEEAAAFLAHSHSNRASTDAVGIERFE